MPSNVLEDNTSQDIEIFAVITVKNLRSNRLKLKLFFLSSQISQTNAETIR
jgi:hypothetical protein